MANFINFSSELLVISNKASQSFINILEDMKFYYIISKSNDKFNSNYNDHPDISIFSFDDKIFVDENVFDYYSENIKDRKLIKVNSISERNLNITYNRDYIFHNEKFALTDVYDEISKKKSFVNINQGYSNCSMICFEKSIITSDFGIFKALKGKFDIHLVSTEGIALHGYKNGFIGGTCGFISSNKLLFYSDVTKYVDYDIIKGVARDNNVEIFYPKSEFFEDLGSIISIK